MRQPTPADDHPTVYCDCCGDEVTFDERVACDLAMVDDALCSICLSDREDTGEFAELESAPEGLEHLELRAEADVAHQILADVARAS